MVCPEEARKDTDIVVIKSPVRSILCLLGLISITLCVIFMLGSVSMACVLNHCWSEVSGFHPRTHHQLHQNQSDLNADEYSSQEQHAVSPLTPSCQIRILCGNSIIDALVDYLGNWRPKHCMVGGKLTDCLKPGCNDYSVSPCSDLDEPDAEFEYMVKFTEAESICERTRGKYDTNSSRGARCEWASSMIMCINRLFSGHRSEKVREHGVTFMSIVCEILNQIRDARTKTVFFDLLPIQCQVLSEDCASWNSDGRSRDQHFDS